MLNISDLRLPTTVNLLLKWYLLLVLISTSGRVMLLFVLSDRLTDASASLWMSFLYGLRMDSIMACFLLLPAALFMHLVPVRFLHFANRVLALYFAAIAATVLFVENATLPFIEQYDVRPNQLFIDYLQYPKEVFGTLWASYAPELIVATGMIIGFVYLLKRTGWFDFSKALAVPLHRRSLVLLPVLVMLVIGGRASFGHRPANPSDAVISDNRLLNEITKNSVHNVIYAARSIAKNDGDVSVYSPMPVEEAYERVSRRLAIASDGEFPFRRHAESHFKERGPKNLIVIIEESLGAQFLGRFGDERGITPNLDALAEEGVWFEHLYSTGTRSIRGLSALVAGMLPVPGKGVIKRNLSQYDFYTVASMLKDHGYTSSFIYGGESRFDNMKSWFSGNGFDLILDEENFPDDVYHGTWGVDDRTVMERANALYKDYHEQDQPFVSVVFSTTNHEPFDYPPGIIEPVAGVPEKSVENAIKFADHAIGRFVELAKASGYYEDTVIVIAADHNVRVYGDDIVPVDMFHIPGLILGAVEPVVIQALESQPDVLATAIDLLGVDVDYPVLGHSIYEGVSLETTLLQFHDIYGLRVKDKLAVVQPGNKLMTFDVTQDDHLKPSEHNEELERDALSFIITLDDLYRKQLHR